MKIFGKDKEEFVEKLIVGDIGKAKMNSCSLSLILNDKGGIMDDVIFSKHANYIGMVLNAGNKYKDMDHINWLR